MTITAITQGAIRDSKVHLGQMSVVPASCFMVKVMDY